MKGLKTGGRQKGTPNKNAAMVRAFCDYIVDFGFDRFKDEFNKLEGEKYVECFLRLAKIVTDDNTALMANKKLIEMLNQKINKNGTNQ